MTMNDGLGESGLGRMLPSFNAFKDDLIENSAAAAGGVAGLWAVEKGLDALQSAVPSLFPHPAVRPAIKAVVGTLAGPMISGYGGKWAKAAGMGVAVIVTASGVLGVLRSIPAVAGYIPSLGSADDALMLADGFSGDNVYAEQLQGADVGVESVDRNFAGVESVLY